MNKEIKLAFNRHLFDAIKKSIVSISEIGKDDVYAISFLVQEGCEGEDKIDLFPTLEVSCNTLGHLSSCVKNGGEDTDEFKWNYAYWPQQSTLIMNANDSNWLKYQKTFYHRAYSRLTKSQLDNCIEKSWTEFEALLVKIARTLQQDGFVEGLFGKRIPIIIHYLEQSFGHCYKTACANPNGEASDYLKYAFDNHWQLKINQ